MSRWLQVCALRCVPAAFQRPNNKTKILELLGMCQQWKHWFSKCVVCAVFGVMLNPEFQSSARPYIFLYLPIHRHPQAPTLYNGHPDICVRLAANPKEHTCSWHKSQRLNTKTICFQIPWNDVFWSKTGPRERYRSDLEIAQNREADL